MPLKKPKNPITKEEVKTPLQTAIAKKDEPEGTLFTAPEGSEQTFETIIGGKIFNLTNRERAKAQDKEGELYRRLLAEAQGQEFQTIKTRTEEQRIKRALANSKSPSLPTIQEIKGKLGTLNPAAEGTGLNFSGESIPSETLTTAETLKAQEKGVLKSAAFIYSSLKTGLGVKKSVVVQAAEAAFTDATAALNSDLALVSSGDLSYEDAARELERAVVALNTIEQEAKFRGQINLRYWLTDGKELEEQIALEKTLVENLRTKLLNAAQTAQINQAKLQAGII